jgi:23S rRNA pseudouridine1911/1915/1917 synthase
MSKSETWLVDEEFEDLRIDQAICEQFEDISRNLAQDMLKNKEILVNGKAVKPSFRLKGGEEVFIEHRSLETITEIEPTPLNFSVIFEDEHLVVVNKPSGLVVHPGAGREKTTVVSAMLSHTQLSPIGAPTRPGIVHRLDKETSGLMVLAKTFEAHRGLSTAFAEHKVDKWYTALIGGRIVNQKGRIEVAIERDKVHRKRMKASSSPDARMAISLFEVDEHLNSASLVTVQILTGRTHQIRVHMAFTGHPLLGDTLYGGRAPKGLKDHFLHSKKLGFEHPITGENMVFEAPLPEEFVKTIEALREKPLL